MTRKMTLQTVFVVALVALLALPAISQTHQTKTSPLFSTSLKGGTVYLRLTGEHRGRLMVSSGNNFASGGHVENIQQRARLGLLLRYRDRIGFNFQLQDVRTWGSELNTLGDFVADGLDVHQAYVWVRMVDALFLKFGRQELGLDNHRIIGTVNWTMQARSFDGIQLIYNKKPYHGRIFYAKLGEKNSSNNAFQMDRDLGILWFRYTRLRPFRMSLLYVLDTDYAVKRVRHTVGGYFDGFIKAFHYSLEGYVQLGEVGDNDILSFMGAIRLGATFKKLHGFGFQVWFDYLSGDDDPSDKKIKSFDTLFATNHKFYGFMDFFLNLPVHTKNRGLMDAGLRIKIKPGGVLLMLDYHYFRTARKQGTSNATLGHEVDFVVAYKFFKYFKVELKYGAFIPGETMKAFNGGNDKVEHLMYLTTYFKF